MKVIQAVNRYRKYGGADSSTDRIFQTLSRELNWEMVVCEFSSSDWTGPDRPNLLTMASKSLWNFEAAKRLRQLDEEFDADLWLFHHLYPVGSPSLYHLAKKREKPIFQILHNWLPWSPSGTLWTGQKVAEPGLHLNFFPEIRTGAWAILDFKLGGCRLRFGPHIC